MNPTSFSNKPVITASPTLDIQNFARLRFYANEDGSRFTQIGDICIDVKTDGDGRTIITTTDDRERKLGDVPCGKIVAIGNHPWVVLGHGKDTTALMSTRPCVTGSCTPYESAMLQCAFPLVRHSLAGVVGESNIIRHTTDLRMANGKNKGHKAHGYVSLLTLDLFQRYYDYLPQNYSFSYVLATQWDENTYITVNNCSRELRLESMDRLQTVAYLPFVILDSRVTNFTEWAGSPLTHKEASGVAHEVQ